jgi:hypothetical protein
MTIVRGQSIGGGCSTLDRDGPNFGKPTRGVDCSTLEPGLLKTLPTEPIYTAEGIALIRKGYQVKQDGSGQRLNDNLGYDQAARLKLSEILKQSSTDTEFTLKGYKITLSSKGPQGTPEQAGFSYITITPPTGSSKQAITVRVHNASGDLSDPIEGRMTSISPDSQNKVNELFANFREEFLGLKLGKEGASATRQIPPVGTDKKSKELANLAVELEKSSERKIGTLIVKSEKPSATQESKQKPSEDRILTLKGTEGSTKDVVATVTLAKNTGAISAATLAGDPLDLGRESDRSKLNELLEQLSQAPSTTPQRPQAPASTAEKKELTSDGVVGPDETLLLQKYLRNKGFVGFLNSQRFEDRDGQLTTVVDVQKKPLQISLNKNSGGVTILFDGQSTSEREHVKLAEELINRQINAFKANLGRLAQPASQK